jgi:hypothetical protein
MGMGEIMLVAGSWLMVGWMMLEALSCTLFNCTLFNCTLHTAHCTLQPAGILLSTYTYTAPFGKICVPSTVLRKSATPTTDGQKDAPSDPRPDQGFINKPEVFLPF